MPIRKFQFRPKKIDLLFLKNFIEKTNARGRHFFLHQIFLNKIKFDEIMGTILLKKKIWSEGWKNKCTGGTPVPEKQKINFLWPHEDNMTYIWVFLLRVMFMIYETWLIVCEHDLIIWPMARELCI